MKREMSVAGSFYPKESEEIIRYFEYFQQFTIEIPTDIQQPKALIVPHAGYIYSGLTASLAYKIAAKYHYEHIVVIGPSHKVGFEGASLCPFQAYSTPLGDIRADTTLYEKINKQFNLPCYTQAHHEHSTEVQFPFIKYYFPDTPLVEIVYSQESPQSLAKIIDFLMQEKDTLILISTDLSHFYDLQTANKLDNICLNAILKKDTSFLHKGCEACGKIGVEALVLSAQKLNLHVKLIDYRTSADASKDTQSVVGYVSAIFYDQSAL